MTPRRARGVVLLHALIVVSVLAAVAAATVRDGLDDRYRYGLMLRSDQAAHHARSAEAAAVALLAADAAATGLDHLGEAWAEPRSFTLDGARVTVRLEDLQGRLNVNALVRRDEGDGRPVLAVVEPLFSILERLAQEAGAAPQAATRLVEWTADGVDGLTGAAGDRPYLRREPPLLRPAQPILSVQALRPVGGLTPDSFARLRPSLTALPKATAINVNTAPLPVLRALLPGLRSRALDRLDADRRDAPFDSVVAFQNYAAARFPPILTDALGTVPLAVKTEWFLLRTDVQTDTMALRIYSVLHRPYDDPGSVILRSFAPS